MRKKIAWAVLLFALPFLTAIAVFRPSRIPVPWKDWPPTEHGDPADAPIAPTQFTEDTRSIEELMEYYRQRAREGDGLALAGARRKILKKSRSPEDSRRLLEEMEQLSYLAERVQKSRSHMPDGPWLSEDAARDAAHRIQQAESPDEANEILWSVRENRIPGGLAGWIADLISGTTDPEIRGVLVEFLGQTPDPECAIQLRRFMGPDYPSDLRIAAVRQYESHQSGVIPQEFFWSLFRSEQDRDVLLALDSHINWQSNPEARLYLRSFLGDENPKIRSMALASLDLTTSENWKTLEEIAKQDSDASVRFAAYSSFAFGGFDRDPSRIAILLEGAEHDPDAINRSFITGWFGSSSLQGNEIVLGTLKRIAEHDPDEAVRSRARQVLKNLERR